MTKFADVHDLASGSIPDWTTTSQRPSLNQHKNSRPITVSKKQKTCSKVFAKSNPASCNEFHELASIGGRDTTLFLFRALGKILYCKRKYS